MCETVLYHVMLQCVLPCCNMYLALLSDCTGELCITLLCPCPQTKHCRPAAHKLWQDQSSITLTRRQCVQVCCWSLRPARPGTGCTGQDHPGANAQECGPQPGMPQSIPAALFRGLAGAYITARQQIPPGLQLPSAFAHHLQCSILR